MTATITKEAAAWKPLDQTMYEDLLWVFGAWDTLEQMNAAMATRMYVADPDGTVGFRLVK